MSTVQHTLVLCLLSEFTHYLVVPKSFATSEILYSNLKANNPEPGPSRVIAVGAGDAGASINAATKLLRSLLGTTFESYN